MKILIAGASGFVGRNLIPDLVVEHDVTVLGRNKQALNTLYPELHAINWESLKEESSADYHLVINLCGENIGERRWSEAQKKKILSSRLRTTETLCDWILLSQEQKLPRLLNASAIGAYGLNTKKNTEDTQIEHQEDCFSQAVVTAWESMVSNKLLNKTNYALMRFGVVLKKHEGMLKKLEIPYRLGLGGFIGSGEQLLSWVHIDDLIQAIIFIIKSPQISGPVNIVAPEVITQTSFAKALAMALHRPCFLKMPSTVVKILFGQMGRELLLSGQGVVSKRLNDVGFLFHYGTLKKALSKEYNS